LNLHILHNGSELEAKDKFVWMEGIRECKKITRKQLGYILRRIYNATLAMYMASTRYGQRLQPRIRIYLAPWLHPWAGWHCYWYVDELERKKEGYTYLYLNPRRNTVKGYLHEMLHYLYGIATEGEILAMEEQMCRMMRTRQWNKLLDCMELAMKVSPKRSPSQLLDIFLQWDDGVKRLLQRQRAEFRKGRIDKEYLKERMNGKK